MDVNCIDRDKHIFGANMVDDGNRRDILTKARLLKDIPEFSTVYLHRDLTYNQRRVFFERRAAARDAKQGEPQSQTSGNSKL